MKRYIINIYIYIYIINKIPCFNFKQLVYDPFLHGYLVVGIHTYLPGVAEICVFAMFENVYCGKYQDISKTN